MYGKNMHGKNMKKTLVIFLIISLFCCACNKESANNVEAGEEEKTIVWEENQIADGIYSLGKLLGNLENVVVAGMYDETNVILVEEARDGNKLNRTVELVSLETGERELKYSHILTFDEAYYGGIYDYKVLCYHPLVLYDYNTSNIQIYSENFSGFCTLKPSDEAFLGCQYSDYDGCLYYMCGVRGKIYKIDIKEYVNGTAYDAGESSDEIWEIQDFDEEAELIWMAERDWDYCSLDTISEDGKILGIYASRSMTDEYLSAQYNLVAGEYDHLYVKEDFYDWESLDKSKYFTSYISMEDTEEYNVFFEYCDYNLGKRYLLQLDTDVINEMDKYAYWMLQMDSGALGYDKGLLLRLEQGDSVYYTDIFLWDYERASVEENIKQPVYQEALREEDFTQDFVAQKRKNIEEKYDVTVYYGEEVIGQVDTYQVEAVVEQEMISHALDVLDETLAIYPEDFLEEVQGNDFGIRIYLTGQLESETPEVNLLYPGAVTVYGGQYLSVAIDIQNTWSLRENIIHEMSHVIDHKLLLMGVLYELEEEWYACNPREFVYYDSYFGYEQDFKDTSYSEHPENAYFYDDYSKTFSTEDRARIMEHFLEYDSLDICYQSEAFKNKIGCYLQVLQNNFESFDENSQWEQTYRQLIEK